MVNKYWKTYEQLCLTNFNENPLNEKPLNESTKLYYPSFNMLPLMKPIKIPIENMYSKHLLICDNLKKNKYKYDMIEKFDINTIKDNESILIIGRRETG